MHAEGLLAVAEEIRRQADEENIQMPLLESLDLSGNPVALQQVQIRNAFQHFSEAFASGYLQWRCSSIRTSRSDVEIEVFLICCKTYIIEL